MSVNICKGQKIEITPSNSMCILLAEVGWQSKSNMEIDTSAFLLGENGKVKDDSDFIFYGNLRHKSGCIEHLGNTKENSYNIGRMEIFLSRLPESIKKIALTTTIYDTQVKHHNFEVINHFYIKIVDKKTNIELLRYDIEKFSVETAVVIGEIYINNGKWKFNAVGSGYQGGLAALCNSFGIKVIEDSDENKHNDFSKSSANVKKQVKTSMSKIELHKGQIIDLTKGKSSKIGKISVNLNWNKNIIKREKTSGFFSSLISNNEKEIDLDLACLYEMKDGSKGLIQALGNTFGFLHKSPYILLDHDDRTGDAKEGENIQINGNKISEFKRILIFTFIYSGVVNWKDVQGIITIQCPNNPNIIVNLDEYDSDKRLCAIAMLENKNDESFSVTKIVRFFDGHKKMDRAFNWGMTWIPWFKF